MVVRPAHAMVSVVAALSLLAQACASAPKPAAHGRVAAAAPAARPQGRSSSVVSGDSSGLGISGAETPAALKAIAAAPYALPVPLACEAIAREVQDLDDLLGPDVDVLAEKQGLDHAAGQALGSAVRGAIPYRWVLRMITQAGRLDRELRQAVMAGAARRGFLKGMAQAMACQPSQVASR